MTIERNGRVLGVGSVLAGDGRVLTALSNLGHGNDLDVRYADGSVSRVRVGHSDRAWDVALLVPQNGRWKHGLRASRLKPAELGSNTHMFGLHDKKVRLSRTILKGERTLIGGDSALLRDAITIGSKLHSTDVGSPIVDKNGDVVAMVARACAPLETAEGEAVCSPVPYGVPVGALRAFLSTAPANAVAPAPWLGVRGIADQVGTTRGVRLLRVDPKSPAAAAGLQGSPVREHSDLIVAVNGAPVSNPDELGTPELALMVTDVIVAFDGNEVVSPERLRWQASLAGVGRTVTMRVARGQKERDLQVTLVELPEARPQVPAMPFGLP